MIYADATEALDRFATRFGIPVAESQAGKGALPWNHPMNAGPIGAAGGLAANRLARDADLVIAIGTRLGDFVTASRTAFQDPGVAFIGINVGGMDAAKQRALPMVADARAALDALTAALEAADWAGHVARLPGADRRGEGRVGSRRSIATARARAAPATPTASSPSPRSSASSTTPSAGTRR